MDEATELASELCRLGAREELALETGDFFLLSFSLAPRAVAAATDPPEMVLILEKEAVRLRGMSGAVTSSALPLRSKNTLESSRDFCEDEEETVSPVSQPLSEPRSMRSILPSRLDEASRESRPWPLFDSCSMSVTEVALPDVAMLT